MAYAIMRAKKHKADGGGLKVALMHLYRERETPNADSTKTNLWFDSDGEQTTKAAIARLTSEIDRVNESRGRNMRRDAVVAVEYLMTASPEWFSDDPKERREEASKFATEARKWLRATYPDGKIIASQVHMDETTPHLSIFVTPTHRLKDDRLSFSAREFLGGPKAIQKQQDSFAEHMKPLGLKRGNRASHASHEAVNRFYGRLRELEGKNSELARDYRAEIHKIDSKMIGGKSEMVELAKRMARDLDTLQSNYKSMVANQSAEVEKARADRLKEQYDRQLSEAYQELEATQKELDSANEQAELKSRRANLYNEGLAAAETWRNTLSPAVKMITDQYVDVLNYEVEIRYYRAGLSDEMPENPIKQGPKAPRM